MSKKTNCYMHFFIPESRKKVNEPIRQDMTVIPEDIIHQAYRNQLGHLVGLTEKLYLGGVIDYRLDSACIEVFHERKDGIKRIAKEMGFARFMSDKVE